MVCYVFLEHTMVGHRNLWFGECICPILQPCCYVADPTSLRKPQSMVIKDMDLEFLVYNQSRSKKNIFFLRDSNFKDNRFAYRFRTRMKAKKAQIKKLEEEKYLEFSFLRKTFFLKSKKVHIFVGLSKFSNFI